MKIFNKIYVMLSLLFVLLCGCEKNYLDINTDPNNPTDSPSSQVLPYTQVAIANSLASGSAGVGNWLHTVMHQTVQRENVDDYAITGDDFQITQPWEKLYGVALTDLRQIIDKETKANNWHYVGIAQIMKAFTFSVLVDIWGDVPFKTANKGAKDPYPSFDSGKEIYQELFKLLDEGMANLDKESLLTPRAEDLIYGGDITKWKKFATSLKLKLYNQARLTDLYDANAVAEIINSGNLMTSRTDNFQLLYNATISPENRNPAFVLEYASGNPNFYISPYFYQILQGRSTLNPIYNNIADPRIPYYFYSQLAPGQQPVNPVSYKDDRFLSIWFSSVNRDPNEGFGQEQYQTLVGLYFAGGKYDNGQGGAAGQESGLKGASPLRILPYFNLLYTKAELALTKGAPGNPRDLFKSAMEASFGEVNSIANTAGSPVISATERDSYINGILALYDAGDSNKKLEHLLTQKWIASFGYSIDLYNDYRRTGYPQLFKPNEDTNPFTVQTRDFPVSFPYSTSDLQINPNAPQQRNVRTDKVFWDVN